MSKPKVSMVGHRGAVVELVRDGEETRIRAALSSDTPVAIGHGITETLRHDADSIDLSRAANGLPLTVGHSERDPVSPDLPVGRVNNIRVDSDGKMRGDMVFDSDARSLEVKGKVERGFAPDISITYRRLEFDGPDADGTLDVSRWMPTAASIVSTPADASVGVGRGDSLSQEAAMPDKKPDEAGDASIIDRAKARRQAGYETGARAEQERQTAIADTAAMLSRSQPHLADDLEALVAECREDTSISIDAFRSHALELFGAVSGPATPLGSGDVSQSRRMPAPGDVRQPLIQAGDDASDKASRGMVAVMYERAGGKPDQEALEGNQYRGWSLVDLAGECLVLSGISTRGMSREQIAKAAFVGSRAISPGTANYVTSNFASVTENVITKRVHDGFADADVTWNRWCSTQEVPDFKQFTVPRLSSMEDLPVVAENAEYPDLSQADAKEAATLVKHGGLFSLSWEAVINDDHSMFNRTATRMGDAANRTIDIKAYAVLTASPGAGPVQGITMGDGNQLFSAAHSNVAAGVGLTLGNYTSLRTQMERQTDENPTTPTVLGIRARHLLVPTELRDEASNLMGSEYLPWVEGAAPGTRRVNTIRGDSEVTATVRLTDIDNWYLAAAAGSTCEIAFLAGNRMPVMERDQGWDTDALHWKIRHPSVAYAIDWRGLAANIDPTV